jgi:hypothetical protein
VKGKKAVAVAMKTMAQMTEVRQQNRSSGEEENQRKADPGT